MNYLKMTCLFLMVFLLIVACGSSNKSKELNIKSPETLLSEGDAQYQAGNFEGAIKTYESLLVLHPTSDLHVPTQLRMAEAYSKMDRFEDQMDLLLRLLRENIIPDQIPQIYLQLGKFYERAAQFNPGILDSDTSDYNKASNYYERAIRYEGSRDLFSKAEAIYRQGLIQAKMSNLSQATVLYETVVHQYPDQPYATLAKMKLRDPSDTSELKIDASTLQQYRETLGEPKQPVEVIPEATPSDLEKTVEEIDPANQ